MKKFWGITLALVALGGFAGAQRSYEQFGYWVVSTSVDVFTDEVQRLAYVPPTEQPSRLRTMVLAVICSTEGANGVLPAVSGHPEIIFDSFTEALYRVDSREARSGRWVVGTSSVAPIGADAQAFLHELTGGERLILRVKPGGDTVEFLINGFADAMRALGCYTGPL